MHPELKSDWVRPGIMLYGASPGGASAEQFGLKPAMTLTSKIIGIQRIGAGEAKAHHAWANGSHPIALLSSIVSSWSKNQPAR